MLLTILVTCCRVCSSLPVSFLWAQNWAHHSRYSLTNANWKKIVIFFNLLYIFLLIKSLLGTVCLLGCQSTVTIPVQFAAYQDSKDISWDTTSLPKHLQSVLLQEIPSFQVKNLLNLRFLPAIPCTLSKFFWTAALPSVISKMLNAVTFLSTDPKIFKLMILFPFCAIYGGRV